MSYAGAKGDDAVARRTRRLSPCVKRAGRLMRRFAALEDHIQVINENCGCSREECESGNDEQVTKKNHRSFSFLKLSKDFGALLIQLDGDADADQFEKFFHVAITHADATV